MLKQLAKDYIASRLNRKVRELLKKHPVRIVTVTGSLGKTSAKIAIGKVLQVKYKVSYSEDSYNTDIGLPLSMFGIKAPERLTSAAKWKKIFSEIDQKITKYPYDVVVLELADDELAMMKKFLSFIQAEIGIITSVAPVHMVRMQSMDKIVDHAWQLMDDSGKIFYNADQASLRESAKQHSPAQGFGTKHGSFRFDEITRAKSGELSPVFKGKDLSRRLSTKMISEQSLYSLLIAIIVGLEFDIKLDKIAKTVSTLEPIKGRMSPLAGVNGCLIIDDSYNSSEEAAVSALETLASFPGRKIAVLGQMNELGSHSPAAHQKVGQKAAKLVDFLVVVGKDATEYTADAAEQAGMRPNQIKRFRTPYEAGHYLKSFVQKGDCILVKGSQDRVYVEEVARILLSPKLKPAKVLVRQTPTWQRRKKKSFAL